jgi:protease-4
LALLGRFDDGFTPILEDSVGVINIEGPITDSAAAVKAIRRFRKNSMVKALVLRVDSPGGGVAASEEIYREALMARTDNDMPVIVSMGSVAASGGYYIASASDRIFATSGTITGSIGVIAPMFNARETLGKLGIKENSVVSGEHKDTGDPFSDQTATERALMQGMVYDMYRQFFQVVLTARHKPITEAAVRGDIDKIVNASHTKTTSQSLEWAAFTTGTVASATGIPVEAETALRRLADGRVYTGEQALHVGLVDEIGTLQDAIDYAGKAAGLGEDPTTVERTPGAEETSWLASSISQIIHSAAAPRQAVEFRAPF